MVAQKVVAKDGKSELDLGIEESIRRCEALLSMAPISLQPILADGAIRRISSKEADAIDPSFEAALEPEWTKNMGLLSGMTDQMQTNASPTSSSENPSPHRLPKLSKAQKPKASNSSAVIHHVDCIPTQTGSVRRGPTQEESTFPEKIVRKRRCSRSRDTSSTATASEDWAIDSTRSTAELTSTTSDTTCLEGIGDKESTLSRESVIQSVSVTGSSVSMEKRNEKKAFMFYGGGLQMEDIVTQPTPSLPSIPTTATNSTDDDDAEETDTRKAPGISVNSDTSKSSCRSYEALSVTITAPQHCNEACEWLDKRSVENSSASDHNFEGNVIRERHLLKPDGSKSSENSAKLKPRGSTTNLRRITKGLVPATERPTRCQEAGPKTCSGRTEGKLKTHVAAMTRLRRLARPRTALYQRYAQTRALKEEEQMSECSFKPVVGRRPDPHSPLSVPIFDRICEIKQRIDLRKRARKIIEKEELEQCSFWPKTNVNPTNQDKEAYQPIHRRIEELVKKRNERIAQARAQETKDKRPTFKPAINQKSVRLFKQYEFTRIFDSVQKGLEAIKVSDRLTSCASSQCEGQAECRARTYQPKDECTFAPEINRNTDEILFGSQLDGCSFLARQQQFLRKLEDGKRKKEMQCEYTFRPNIGNASVILQCSPQQDGNEKTLDERLERLSRRDSQRRFYLRQKISDNYYSQFKFQPKIDQMSRLLSPSTNLQELHSNEKGKRTKEVLQQAAEQEFVQACTFHPEVNARKSAGSSKGILENRRKFRKEKAKNIEQLKIQKEMQEFKECTFKPAVHPVPLKEKEPVVIKGLNRHLELQDLAKQLKKDQEEWERKVFYTHVNDLPKRQYTIPKPFVLHSGRAAHSITPPQKGVKRNQ